MSPGTLLVSDVALGSMTQTVILPEIWRIRMLPFSKYAYSERSISNHIYLPRVFCQYSKDIFILNLTLRLPSNYRNIREKVFESSVSFLFIRFIENKLLKLLILKFDKKS